MLVEHGVQVRLTFDWTFRKVFRLLEEVSWRRTFCCGSVSSGMKERVGFSLSCVMLWPG